MKDTHAMWLLCHIDMAAVTMFFAQAMDIALVAQYVYFEVNKIENAALQIK
ncbi:hypothetical protein [Acinetobacter sp. YH12049]|uniref:hypothetical protein n=1 Tax=Acinetobacter TaxID=469 RepID=UPI0015D371C6|nr:hypothetical protein [Acinetobacter sp. YH12049]